MRTLHVILLTAVVAAVTAAATVWLVDTYLLHPQFEPVRLDAGERRILQTKLERLRRTVGEGRADSSASSRPDPEPYRETGEARTIHFTERELNALLADNTDLSQRVAIDLAEGLVSAKLLVDLPPEFPVLGGKTLRAHAGLELIYNEGRPRVVLQGVSVWGVPLPGAWLGGLKGIDLVEAYGREPGFWRSLAAGVEDVRVREGTITLRLKE